MVLKNGYLVKAILQGGWGGGLGQGSDLGFRAFRVQGLGV